MTDSFDTPDIKDRLLKLCKGHPRASIPWPHRDIHEAIEYIFALEAAAEKMAGALEFYAHGYLSGQGWCVTELDKLPDVAANALQEYQKTKDNQK